jgi:uncharacterized protein involved in outer membrane biogenesis
VLEGEWLASFATGTQPRVEAKLRSSRVRLRDLGLSESAKPPARVASPAAQRGGKSAGGEIDPEPLRKLDADVSLQVDQITGVGESRLENVTLAIKLDSGLLAVNGYAVGGTPDDPSRYDLAFTLDARSRSPSYELHLEGSQVDIAEWMRQLQVEGKSSGVADVLLDLRTRGRKRAEMRANLDGYAGMSLRGAYLVSATMRRFVVNIARVAFPTIRSSEVESSPVSCLRGEFDVERGVASVRELLLQGPSESVSGSGRIDLGGNAYDLTFTPHSRNPALIGVAATVRVTGPLQDPKISAVPRSLATSAARGILANAMRPARAVLSPIRSSDPERIDACARPLLRNADAASR